MLELKKKRKEKLIKLLYRLSYIHDILFRKQNLLSFPCFRREADMISVLYFNKCGSLDPKMGNIGEDYPHLITDGAMVDQVQHL